MDNNKEKSFLSLASCGIEFASAIAVAVLLGVWLDKHFEKSPLFLVIFFLLGCVSGYFNILRYANNLKKK